MSQRRIADQIVRSLREADRALAQGLTVADVCRKPCQFIGQAQAERPSGVYCDEDSPVCVEAVASAM